MSVFSSKSKGPHKLGALSACLFAVALAVLLFLALLPVFPRQVETQEGDTASRTWQSPRDFSFESAVLTEKQREQAAAAVSAVLVFSSDVRDTEAAKLGQLVDNIANVRDRGDLTRSQKLGALRGTENLFAPDLEPFILDMSGEQWQKVSGEAKDVLKELLAGTVKSGEEGLIGQRIPGLLDPSLSAEEASIVEYLVKPFIAPNLQVDDVKTKAAKDDARANVVPVRVSYTKNQTIVRAGDIVDSTAVEAMREAGLLSQTIEWHGIASVLVLSILAAAGLGYYVYAFQPENTWDVRRLVLLLAVTGIAVLAAKLFLPLVLPDHDRHFLAYVLPLAAMPMLVAVLIDGQLAIVCAALLGALVTFIVVYLPDVSTTVASGPLDALRAVGVYGFGGVAGALGVYKAERLNRYALAGLLVAVVVFAVLTAVWFLDFDREAFDFGWFALIAAVNGLFSATLALGAFVLLGFLFGIVTRVQLMELAQINQPLLRRLQDEAPGTFHHSIIVGNMAERAADLIGADALLVRVGCYYHDVGKLRQPGYYIENQMSGSNPHDNIDLETSAQIISRHVKDGQELARDYGLPRQVRDFIAQHHGTGRANYFYRKALEEDKDVDVSLFSYPGPKPQTREAAVIMLADSSEAAIRASAERSPEEIDARVDEVVATRLAEGQLDDSDLTLREIKAIAGSFKATLRGVYHPRLEYPPSSETGKPGREKRPRKSRAYSIARTFLPEDEGPPPDEEADSQ